MNNAWTTQINIKKPGLFTVMPTIGWVTFREIVRDKILYNSILCALLLLAVGYFASKLTFTRHDRIMLDFGLSAVSIACTFIAILITAPLLAKEFDRRTAFVTLSKPITRFQFLLGKFAGLFCVLTINWFLLCLVFLLCYYSVDGRIHLTLILALILVWFQSIFMASMTLLISSFSTTSLSVIISIGIYLLGTNISQVRFVASKVDSGFEKIILDIFSLVFPNLEWFNLGTHVTYGLPVSPEYFIMAITYSVSMVILSILISGFLIHRKEI